MDEKREQVKKFTYKSQRSLHVVQFRSLSIIPFVYQRYGSVIHDHLVSKLRFDTNCSMSFTQYIIAKMFKDNFLLELSDYKFLHRTKTTGRYCLRQQSKLYFILLIAAEVDWLTGLLASNKCDIQKKNNQVPYVYACSVNDIA